LTGIVRTPEAQACYLPASGLHHRFAALAFLDAAARSAAQESEGARR